MVEIAIAVAIIAFALVAIIGILPAGLQVQKENREDTLIGQDGSYFIEAIRNGSGGLDELANLVRDLRIERGGSGGRFSGHQIISRKSAPAAWRGFVSRESRSLEYAKGNHSGWIPFTTPPI